MIIVEKYKKLFTFILLAYVITWVLWLPLIVLTPPIKIFHQLGAIGPLVAAFLTSYMFDGVNGVKKLLKRVIDLPLRWTAIAFICPFILFFISSLISGTLHNAWPNYLLLLQSQEYPSLGIMYWVISIICYGFGEQVGWRGIALPELTKGGLNAIFASTLLGIIWALWHIPLFWYPNSGYYTMNSDMIIGWILSLILSSYLLTWIFNTSKKRLVPIAVFHGTIDIVVTSMASQGDKAMIMSILLMFLGVAVIVVSGKNVEGLRSFKDF
jgi:membrane protease YdiL (CAAX protease family)